LRESLYIPATKAVKFKSKSWIDGFGAKLSKTAGSGYNYFTHNYLAPISILSVNICFFSIVIFAWIVMANALGRRFEKAVKNNEVIGAEG
jgi:AAA family ATP:ADP antiporter